jgi:hypothetical protein
MLLGSNVYVQRFVQAIDLPPQNLANYEIVIRVDGSIDCTFTYGKRLYQEWVVDQYSKVEGQRLQWVRLNQTTLRVDQYKGMVDAM